MRKIVLLIILILLVFILIWHSSGFFGKFFKFDSGERDPKMCEKIISSKQKDYCYQQVANNLEDRSICEKIVDSQIKNVCYENLNLF